MFFGEKHDTKITRNYGVPVLGHKVAREYAL